MKHLKALPALTALITFLLSPALYAADKDSHLQQVETLFRLTNMEQKVDQSIDSVMQLQLSQNPQLSQHADQMRAFFEKHIGWDALKSDITDMYLQTFSEKELEAINAFYITPAGQKVITALPVLVQQRNQLAMQRLQENIGELRQIVAPPVTQ
ncbi:MAG: DUF2059 domain-containing protein [Gammaproteobacteria bacterium]|jgi:hypothetical protein